jgi:N-acetyl-anhydromuramyl-L-alanine amidase AmpD
MAFTNSSLVSYTQISPNRNSPRNQPISKITIHHCAAVMSVEQFGNLVANPSRQMSSNYCIGNDGRIGLYCPEGDRSWCSSSPWNDHRAITIEVSNDVYGEPWSISTAAYNSLIRLCVDICKRNGIKNLEFTGNQNGSLTYHYMFSSTACPGTWIKNHTQEICNKVNAQLSSSQPTSQSTTSSKFSVGDLVKIKSGARYYDGGAIPNWVLAENWYISSIGGDRAVLGNNESKSRNIQSPINISNLTMVKAVNATTGEIKKLDKGTVIYDNPKGKQVGTIDVTTNYTIIEEKTVDYTKYGKLKSGVGWVIIEKLKRKFDINNQNDVKELQMTLTSKGFKCNAADGKVDSSTTNAMFQALCELWLQVK